MSRWRHEYHVKVDATPRIRWCRQNLGDRGGRWDFIGGARKATIYIRSDEDAMLYDKHWRFWNVLQGNSQEESHHLSRS
jgi:hypothetical protein